MLGWGGGFFGGYRFSVHHFPDPVPGGLVSHKCEPFGGHGGIFSVYPRLKYPQVFCGSGSQGCGCPMSMDVYGPLSGYKANRLHI